MNNKSDLRETAKKIRKNLDMIIISKAICTNIKNNEYYKTSEHIMIFYPMKNEINLLYLMDDNKKFYLPRVKGTNLEVCPYRKNDPLNLSDKNIYEPLTPPINKNDLDIVFVPALMCDKNKCRLGYGGGFYDRFIKDGSFKSIVVIPEELTKETLPQDNFDIKCDEMITQKKASF